MCLVPSDRSLFEFGSLVLVAHAILRVSSITPMSVQLGF